MPASIHAGSSRTGVSLAQRENFVRICHGCTVTPMRTRLFHPATIIATIALFISLTGTGYAVTQLPKNSVGNTQLKKNAVTASKVKNGSLLAEDFKTGELPQGAKGDTGATGAQGERGASGERGLQGPQGAQGVPGPTASGQVTSLSGTTLNSSSTVLASLSEASNTITTTEPMRLIANSQIYVFKTIANASNESTVSCYLEYKESADVSWTGIGEGSEVFLPAAGVGVTTHGTVVATGAAPLLSAGTYDVRVACRYLAAAQFGGTVASWGSAHINAFAVAADNLPTP